MIYPLAEGRAVTGLSRRIASNFAALTRDGARPEGSSGTGLGETLDAGECDDEGRIRLLLTFVGAALPGP